MADIEFTLTRRGRKMEVGAGLDAWATSLNTGMKVSASQMPGAMRAHLKRIVDVLAAKHGNKWPEGTTSSSLSTRSGSLLASLQSGVRVAGSTFADTKGSLSGLEYLAIHEYGGTLVPRTSQYLTIPLPAALNSDGTPIHDNPRDWGNTFVQQSRAGNLLVFRRLGSGIEPLYALKTQVTIPARFGARQAAKEQMPYFTSKVLDSVMKELRS